MNIEEAKKDLERKIISWDGVNGIGVIDANGIEYIEIAVDSGNSSIKSKIKQLCPTNKWEEYKIKIVSSDPFSAHSE